MNILPRIFKTIILSSILLFFGACATQLAYIPVVGLNYKIPSNFKIVGYFPSWSGDPDTVQYQALTHICYAFAKPTMSGECGPIPNPDKLIKLVTNSHKTDTKVLLSFGDSFDDQPKGFDSIAADSDITEVFLNNTIALISQYNLDGVDIDLEYPTSQTAQIFASLINKLAKILHANGKLLSIAVSADQVHGQDFLSSIIADVDFLNIMAYDDGFDQNPIIPHSSYRFARAAMDYWIDDRHVPASKAILGVPFYGRSLKDRHSISYFKLHKYDFLSAASDLSGDFSYNGFDIIRAKTVNQARLRGGGIMVWQLNQDANGSDSLLNAIFDAIKEPSDQND